MGLLINKIKKIQTFQSICLRVGTSLQSRSEKEEQTTFFKPSGMNIEQTSQKLFFSTFL